MHPDCHHTPIGNKLYCSLFEQGAVSRGRGCFWSCICDLNGQYQDDVQVPIFALEHGCVLVAGLFRVRGFTQDDAHIFCLPEQIAGEIVGVLALVEEVMGAFGFKEFEVRLHMKLSHGWLMPDR